MKLETKINIQSSFFFFFIMRGHGSCHIFGSSAFSKTQDLYLDCSLSCPASCYRRLVHAKGRTKVITPVCMTTRRADACEGPVGRFLRCCSPEAGCQAVSQCRHYGITLWDGREALLTGRESLWGQATDMSLGLPWGMGPGSCHLWALDPVWKFCPWD